MKIAEFYPQLEDFLMSHNGVEQDLKKEWGWKRFMVRGKMFCAFCGEDSDNTLITVKSEPDFNMHIRELYKGDIIEGYYMNKLHWNSVYPDRNVPYEVIQDMCERGYNLILHSFSKKVQLEIIEQNNKN